MKIKNKIVIPLLLLFGFFALVLLISCGKEEKVKKESIQPVKIFEVKNKSTRGFNFPCVVDAGRKVNLSFRVGGRIIELPIKEGDRVQKGQLIAKLDPKDIQLMVNSSKAQYLKTQADYERYQVLYEKDAIPLATLDLIRAQRDIAKSQYEDATKKLGYTKLTAPFSGVIGSRFVENYMDIMPQLPIISLNNVDEIEAVINVPESLVQEFSKAGHSHEIYALFDNKLKQKYALKVKEVSTQADKATQTFKVRLSMQQSENMNLFPGMTGQVYVNNTNLDESEKGFVIPSLSVLDAVNKGFYVWVINQEDNSVSRRPVSVGSLIGNESIKVLSGLRDGELIVVSGLRKLKEGMKVKIWEEQRKGI